VDLTGDSDAEDGAVVVGPSGAAAARARGGAGGGHGGGATGGERRGRPGAAADVVGTQRT